MATPGARHTGPEQPMTTAADRKLRRALRQRTVLHVRWSRGPICGRGIFGPLMVFGVVALCMPPSRLAFCFPATASWTARRPCPSAQVETYSRLSKGVRCRSSRSSNVDVVDNPWIVLGLQEGAAKNEIKARFKQLVATEHPDKHPGDRAAAVRFKQITAAYKELSEGPDEATLRDRQYRARDAAEAAVSQEMADELNRMGLDVEEVRNFLQGTVRLAGSGIFLTFCIFAYYIFFDAPENLLDIVFADAAKSRGSSAPQTEAELMSEDVSPELKKHNEFLQRYLADY